MKPIVYQTVVALLFCLISCDDLVNSYVITSKVGTNIEQIKRDTIQGMLKRIELQLPEFIISYHDKEFKKQLEKGEYYLFSSKKYISFKIVEQSNFEASLGWKVFLIKGELQLSEDDFAEYDFYGLYRGDKVYSYAFLAQPVEIVTKLETYEVTDNSATILGRQWDLSGNEDGTKPPKEQSTLIIFP